MGRPSVETRVMNRTALFLTLAAGLLVTAVVVGLPKVAPVAVVPPKPEPPSPTPAVQVQPAPPPTPPAPLPAAHPGSLTMTGSVSHPYISVGTTDVFATFDIDAVKVPGAARAPVNLALVIDRSGSMSGAKLRDAKRAAHRLVDLLQNEDRLAIVDYGTDTNLFSSRYATDENRAVMHHRIDGIMEGGGTNIGDGLRVAQRELSKANGEYRVNRLLLMTDGQPTVGMTDNRSLTGLVGAIHRAGVTTTALGVGADFNETLMQRMADMGGGSYGFVRSGDATSLQSMFERDLSQAASTVARAVTIHYDDTGLVSSVMGRPSSCDQGRCSVTLPDFAAGQHERVVMQLRARAATEGMVALGHFTLDYQDVLASGPAKTELALSAFAVHDRVRVTSGINRQAYVAGKQAQAQVNYEQAADLASVGDTRGAQAALQKNVYLFDDASAVAGPAAVEKARQDNTQAFGLMAAPASAEVRREQAKDLKIQGLRTSGRGESVY